MNGRKKERKKERDRKIILSTCSLRAYKDRGREGESKGGGRGNWGEKKYYDDDDDDDDNDDDDDDDDDGDDDDEDDHHRHPHHHHWQWQ